jgi:4-hydroxythreonine-4-phosphate dehydrogenase
MSGLLAIADDLSGAAETAAALGGAAAVVELIGTGPAAEVGSVPDDGRVVVRDCDVRYATAADAQDEFERVLGTAGDARVFVKVDSLLRGNVGAAVRAARRLGRTIVVAPALPAAARTVEDGRPLVAGQPLSETALWDTEAAAPPDRIEDLFDFPTEQVSTAVLRRGGLPALIRHGGTSAPQVLVVDAAEDRDLDLVAHAAWWRPGNDAVLVGSRALAEAVGRMSGVDALPETPAPQAAEGGVLVVVGSADSAARRQFDRLVSAGVAAAEASAPELISGSLAATRRPVFTLESMAAVTALRISPEVRVAPTETHALAAAFADAVADAIQRAESTPALVLIGGETARLVLERLRVSRLTVVGSSGDGIVHSVTDTGLRFITRPGSFGDDEHLLRLVRQLTPHRTSQKENRKASA